MAWKGLYTLELTCDRNGGHYIRGRDGISRDTLGHVKDEFPHVFTGELGNVMRQNARRVGWMVGATGTAVCPKCTKKQTRRDDEQAS